MNVGDICELTVPSRDSSGYSKQNTGHFTIPVKVLSLDTHGALTVATVEPVLGTGQARVSVERLKRLDLDDPMPQLPPEEPIEVTLTRALLVLNDSGPVSEPHWEEVSLDIQVRRHLHQALGYELCTGRCRCDSLSECHYDLPDGIPCTGSWTGCDTCNENAITYCEGVGEYDICRRCHWEGLCLTPSACGDECEVYPDSPRHPGNQP